MDLKNKRILVTGADGFIGSHLVERLYGQCKSITALSQYNSFGSIGWLNNVFCKDDINIVSGDIRDSKTCFDITKEIDIIFHLAALISIPYSYESPRSYVETNVLGTTNICEAAVERNIQKLIHTSTSEVYGSAQTIPMTELHPLVAQSPYSASKIAADAIVTSFHRSYALQCSIIRPFNTYGPRQSMRAVIPSIIIQLLKGDTVTLGKTFPTRDFNYVTDTADAFIELAKSDKLIGRSVNAGSGLETSIKDMVDIISFLMRKTCKVKHRNDLIRPTKSEVDRLCAGTALIRDVIGWKPKHDLKTGLMKTISWFEKNRGLDNYEREQI